MSDVGAKGLLVKQLLSDIGAVGLWIKDLLSDIGRGAVGYIELWIKQVPLDIRAVELCCACVKARLRINP